MLRMLLVTDPEPETMTKKTELEHLDRFIATLGRDSYIGPWLAEARDSIAQDITSDLMPRAPLPREAYAEAQRIIAEARAEMSAERERTGAALQLRRDKFDSDLAAARAHAAEALRAKANELIHGPRLY